MPFVERTLDYDAWLNDTPDDDDPICPICGGYPDDFYQNDSGDIIGCDCCISAVNASEWIYEREKALRDVEIDHQIDLARGK